MADHALLGEALNAPLGFIERVAVLLQRDVLRGRMLLFGDAANPSNGFYEAFGAVRLYDDTGEFHGGYGWRDLGELVARCNTTSSARGTAGSLDLREHIVKAIE